MGGEPLELSGTVMQIETPRLLGDKSNPKRLPPARKKRSHTQAWYLLACVLCLGVGFGCGFLVFHKRRRKSSGGGGGSGATASASATDDAASAAAGATKGCDFSTWESFEADHV